MDSVASPVALSGSSGWAPITIRQVLTKELKPGEKPIFDEEAAVSLVVQDYNRARTELENKGWLTQWQDNDILYQSPLLPSDDPGRARVSRFTVNNQVNTMADAVRAGLFAQKPPFMARPRGDTTQYTVDAWSTLIDTLLDRMNFRYWVGLGVDCQTLHGTCCWKGGWSFRERIVWKRMPKKGTEQLNLPAGSQTVNTTESDDFDLVPQTIKESYPWIEHRMLGMTFFDPGWRTPNKPDLCGYVVDVEYPSWNDLEQLRKDGYDIPDAEELKRYAFSKAGDDAMQGSSVETQMSRDGSPVLHAESRARATTSDPLSQPIDMMLERWDEDGVKSVLGVNGTWVLIRNEPHKLGRIPHFTSNWRNILNEGWGMGIGKLVGGDQRIEQGVLNHSLNLLAYQFNPVILHALGQNAPTQNRFVRAGGFYGVQPLGNDVRNSMALMDMPRIPDQAWTMLQYSKASSTETSGADETFQQGQLQSRGSSAARTATGASRIASKSDARVQTPVENLELGLFVPFLNMLVDMVRMYMPLSEIRQILSAKDAKVLQDDFDSQKFIEADFELEMLAASKLAAKAAMAQQLPYLLQLFNQPQLIEQLHFEGKTIDLLVVLDVLFQVSEYRVEKDIIRDMTDTEKQMVQQMHAPNVKVQEATATEQVKGQQAQQLEAQRAQNKLVHDVVIEGVKSQAKGEKSPMDRAQGLIERGADEKELLGEQPSPIAGV